ncbi:PIN domain-containing protein [Oscillatoria sp. FACHB-1406]|uniref:type II toxin-antitoxin system VapC family toxin n=1 Tax=Oscillatoria sp. FACHB-1406 TaxID=2692846 RepID=UPI001684372E|nr:PIN domain-containing protein [Oscillatoria sp. FACHB-1406]MBD2579209.1 type II toxin-antitoxin system VapC family toxin [Oscillatoria sp. FACHB-1406]
MSEIIVLDTHIWFWWINREFERFPLSWQDRIETAEEVGVSALSCYEIAIANKRRRLELPCPVNLWLQEALEPAQINLLPFTPKIACRAVNLSSIHKDPFDRAIIATALEYEAKLASVDGLFIRYPELAHYLLPPE